MHKFSCLIGTAGQVELISLWETAAPLGSPKSSPKR